MKFKNKPTEHGEEWMDAEPHWTYYLALIAVGIGVIILVAEYSGLADHIISSFN